MVFRQDRFTDDYDVIPKEMQEETIAYMKKHPVILFLPATYEHATNSKVMGNIINVIKKLQKEHGCFEKVVLGLDKAETKKKFKKVQKLFSVIPDSIVIWNNSPEMEALYKKIEKSNGSKLIPGKGRNLWVGFGYRFSSSRKSSFILHDCDIVPEYYNRSFLLALIAPIVHPKYEERDFAKAYYTRLKLEKSGGKALSGRVTRLLVFPFLDALKENYCFISKTMLDYIDFLRSIKYPLSGEFAMRGNIADIMRVQPDWGLEISTLNFIFQKRYRTVQVNMGIYDHDHSPESAKDPSKGLNKMAGDIIKTIFRKMYSIAGDIILDDKKFQSMLYDFDKFAGKSISTYRRVSKNHDWSYNYIKELRTTQTFREAIVRSFKEFKEAPGEIKPLPHWDRVESDFRNELCNIIKKYN